MTNHEPHHRPHRHGPHHHGGVELDEAFWAQMAEHTEREGEVLLPFVTDALALVRDRRDAGAGPVHRILDVGSGPGVGSCELAQRFPEAQVLAVDGSPAMLARATRRATALGLGDRVRTLVAELPGGLADRVLFDDGPIDLIWASMSLHHVADEVAALRVLHAHTAPGGILALAEVADAMRVLPDDPGVGRPGLADRLARGGDEWFARMRAGIAGATPSLALDATARAAGWTVLDDRVLHLDLDAPLGDAAHAVALRHLERTRHQLEEHLDADDLHTLTALGDPADPHHAAILPRLVLRASRRLLLARV